ATPLAFLLFIPLGLAVAWMIYRSVKKRPTIQFSSLQFAKTAKPSLRAKLKWFPAFLMVAALSCAIVALARPQKSDTKVKKNVEGIDIMLTLDISDSMLIEDMKPHANRMEAAKTVLADFVRSRENDRIGLVVFMGEAFTKVPLTLDHSLLLKAIAELQPSRNIKMGTAIGSALATAVGRIKDSEAKSRVIVFATDGESNSGTIDPETALDIAKGFGLKIYSIGIGRDGDAQLPIETIDIFGRKIKRYQPIHSSVNDTLLGNFAKSTGGKYYRATDAKGLKTVFDDIGLQEKSKIDVNQYTKYTELFPPWLQAAVVLALFSILLAQTIFRRTP
ncbi:MAG: VWA domain-containing protein, partial [Bdellovibrionota bacterium]